MKKILFTPIAFEQYNEWQTENKQVFNKIKKLIKETLKTPFEGSGKPEPLKYDYAGCWSRRITDEHRLIYIVKEEWIEIIACKFHY
ncbi:Txe/YoeB family addiction module toxin [Taibaiella lutea]|uniref:Putative mRNA interferase YoeB n=1 Tax=Taibaiella lutea TaxID=2608001 RepID=A0A5M6CN73_9BACT|nr:Txe/YoeB family addiction module toxin [Taibaiella lutea]KAA5536507.1 Txe/YoeB family addiction module toxin [Taibaiella lutea]